MDLAINQFCGEIIRSLWRGIYFERSLNYNAAIFDGVAT